jgi:hypothetical protein
MPVNRGEVEPKWNQDEVRQFSFRKSPGPVGGSVWRRVQRDSNP